MLSVCLAGSSARQRWGGWSESAPVLEQCSWIPHTGRDTVSSPSQCQSWVVAWRGCQLPARQSPPVQICLHRWSDVAVSVRSRWRAIFTHSALNNRERMTVGEYAQVDMRKLRNTWNNTGYCTHVQHESDEQYCSFLSNGCRTFRAVALCQLLQLAIIHTVMVRVHDLDVIIIRTGIIKIHGALK